MSKPSVRRLKAYRPETDRHTLAEGLRRTLLEKLNPGSEEGYWPKEQDMYR
jgi:hypothetical protein